MGEDPIYGLSGNKIDQFENEEVKKEEGEKYAQKIGAQFQQASAKEKPELFKELVNELLKQYFFKNKDIIIRDSESITVNFRENLILIFEKLRSNN